MNRVQGSLRGMTLVEVVLALGLFVMLGLFVSGVVRSVLGIWQTSERQGRGDLEYLAALERLQSDLAALHTGPRGWLSLDSWELRSGRENEEPWLAPRLRFLARGSGLRAVDPEGRSAVEVMWTLVPEDNSGQRISRLVRMTQPANSADSLASDRYAAAMAKTGAVMPILDGIGWFELNAIERDGRLHDFADVAPETPVDFPRSISFSIDRIEGLARTKPPQLDADLSSGPGRCQLRGPQPLGVVDTVLIEGEWVELKGSFPRMTITQRGVRGTAPISHSRDSGVLFFRRFGTKINLPSQGKRLQP